jgi:hypothetical protein
MADWQFQNNCLLSHTTQFSVSVTEVEVPGKTRFSGKGNHTWRYLIPQPVAIQHYSLRELDENQTEDPLVPQSAAP